MKKLAFAAFGALLMIMLASCSPKTEKTVGNAPFFVNHHFDFVECDNVIYFVEEVGRASGQEGTTLLSYRFAALDIETCECMPLCFKPDCTHEGKDCGAYVSADGVRLTLYNGRLYWIEGGLRNPILYSMNTDGSDRKRETAVDAELYRLAYGMGTAEIFDGTLYVCGIAENVKEGDIVRSAVVFRQPLNKEKGEIIRYSEEHVRVFGRIMDGKLYFAESEEWPEEYDEEEGYDPLSTLLYSFDPASGVLTELYSRTDPVTAFDQLAASEGKVYLFGYGHAAVFDVSDGSAEELSGTASSIDVGEDVLMYWDPAHVFTMRSSDGSVLYKGVFPSEDDPDIPAGIYARTFIGSVGAKMYYRVDLFGQDMHNRRFIVEFDAGARQVRRLYASADE